MFNAALIVFRETLEAALIIGIIAAATRMVPRRSWWIAAGVGAGLAGALGIASVAGTISRWANGMGHELFSATVLALAVAMLAAHNIWMSGHGRKLAADARAMATRASAGELAMSAVTLAIALTVLREGAETVLFFMGILASQGAGAGTLLEGGLIGLAAGALAGVAIFSGLMRIPVAHFFKVTTWLLLLVLAGMAAQLAQILIQADLIPPFVQPLWDTSAWVPPDSGLGTLLHALVGYDPQPSATEVGFAVAVVVGVLLATRLAGRPWRSA